MDRFITSDPIELAPSVAAGEFEAADLIFYGVDASWSSYTARVFLDAPGRRKPDTSPDRSAGYAGFFTIFGHGGCVGDPGHCDADSDATTRDDFDTRPEYGLTPQTKSVDITQALRAHGGGPLVVTVLAVVPSKDGAQLADVMRFTGMRLTTYRGTAAAAEAVATQVSARLVG
jgi:tyrosinase